MSSLLFNLDSNATDKVVEVRQTLDSLFQFFTNDPVALLCETFSFFHNSLQLSSDDIRKMVSSSLSYLEECQFKLVIDSHSDSSTSSTSSFTSSKVKQDIETITKICSEPFLSTSVDQHSTHLSKLRRSEYIAPWLESWISRVSQEIQNLKTEAPLSSLLIYMIHFFTSSPPLLDYTLLLRIQVFSLVRHMLSLQSLSTENKALCSFLLTLQPTKDLCCSALANTQSWLATQRFHSLVTSSAQKGGPKPPSAARVYKALDTLPFSDPSGLTFDLLLIKISNMDSRSETFIFSLKRIKSLLNPNSIICDKEKRINFWISFLEKNIEEFPPSYGLIPVLLEEFSKFSHYSEFYSLLPRINSIIKSIKQNSPPVSSSNNQPLQSYLLSSASLPLTTFTYSSQPSSLPSQRLPIYNGVSSQMDDSHPFASVEGVWVGYIDGEEGEEMVSEAGGRFELFRRQFSWVAVENQSNEQSDHNGDVLAVKYSDISKWTWKEDSAEGILFLVIHTEKETFKFFPFSHPEIRQLALALSDVTEKPAFDSNQITLINQKIVVDSERIAIVQKLANHPKWIINHTVVLHKVLGDLINPVKPLSLMGVERVFHSCRNNPEVTKETLADLRRKWSKAKSTETIRIRILSVVDRLLDRTILSRENFSNLSEWLSVIEEQLDPYKSPQSLRQIHILKTRCNVLKAQLITPLSDHQIEEKFELLDQYEERASC
ncbi:hypothetical protein P9112_012031 [Eukaryota sp. TZLM1-RC]